MKLIAVFVHELCHAMACWMTCGTVKAINVEMDEVRLFGTVLYTLRYVWYLAQFGRHIQSAKMARGDVVGQYTCTIPYRLIAAVNFHRHQEF
jgi:hypothetical protein